MSDAEENAKVEEGARGATVTDLPDTGRRVESEPGASEPDGGGGFWKLSTFALLAALIVSGGFNILQLGARGDLETEAAQSAEQLADEISRADEAEETANSLRELVGDVHANMTALQASLTEMLATTSEVVSAVDEPTAAAPEEEAAPFDAAFEAVGDAFEAAAGEATQGADTAVDAATSVFDEAAELSESALPDIVIPPDALPDLIEPEIGLPELVLPDAELPDVSAPFVDAEPGSQPAERVSEATPSPAWTRARDWFTGLFDRAE